MSATDDDTLERIFVELSEDGTVTERQEEGHSHEPVGEETLAVEEDAIASTEDGLDDAVEGTDGGG